MADPEKLAFRDRVITQLNQIAPVTARAMFGGYGLYLDGLMFGLIADNVLYFKVDDGNRADFVAADMGPFVYEGKKRPIEMSYFRLPETVFEDLAELHHWLEQAHAAAKRAKQKSPKRSKKQP
ncbi:MAG: TfoX/Sxy family protein [Cyanobacteria bacterium J06635_15]